MATMGHSNGVDDDETFYEDDEPLEKIMAAFEQGEHGMTGPVVSIDTHGLAVERITATQPGIVTLASVATEPVHPALVTPVAAQSAI